MRVLLALLGAASAPCGPAAHGNNVAPVNVVDAALAAALASAPVDVSKLNSRLPTTTLAKTRTITREGLYGDYTVEIIDEPNPLDGAVDVQDPRADQEGQEQARLGLFVVLLFGSFVIPMAQCATAACATRRTRRPANEEPPPPPPAPKDEGGEGVRCNRPSGIALRGVLGGGTRAAPSPDARANFRAL